MFNSTNNGPIYTAHSSTILKVISWGIQEICYLNYT
jgi:hypothetical protein